MDKSDDKKKSSKPKDATTPKAPAPEKKKESKPRKKPSSSGPASDKKQLVAVLSAMAKALDKL
jgi:hypothetical protein